MHLSYVIEHLGSVRGVFRRRAVGRSRERRSAVRLVTGSRKARDPARQALRPGCEELAGRIGRECPRRKRGPRPKIAAVERREARMPRSQGACSRRLASAFDAPRSSALTRVLTRYAHHGCLASTRAVSALRSPSSGSNASKPRALRAAATRLLARCLKSL
jgi:hypothetical protein